MEHQPGCGDHNRIQSILVIDDHPLYCFALSVSLRRVFDECNIETAATLAEGLKCLSNGFEPDLVMLDLRLPDVAGISGFLRLHEVLPETPILIISAMTSQDVVQALVDAGATGFVPKDVPIQVLQEALVEVRAGRKFLPVEYRDTVRRRATRGAELEAASRKISDLTPQQTRIMKLICVGKTNKQIANELSLAEPTVKAHITALLRRLGVRNRTQAAVMMRSTNLEDSLSNTAPSAEVVGT